MSAVTEIKPYLLRWLPPLAGAGLIWLFLSLASWQLDRAAEKEALAALFDDTARATDYDPQGAYELYQPVRAAGRYRGERQFLIDNIVRNARLGYYVITPFETAPGEALVLVNRGWVARPQDARSLPDIAVGGDYRRIAARIGRLPRVAIRPGTAIEAGQDWPRVAVYPDTADIAASLGRQVDDRVLLLAPQADDGFLRQWQPRQNGAMMHYGYAFQWSAMALAVLLILAWQLRKSRRNA